MPSFEVVLKIYLPEMNNIIYCIGGGTSVILFLAQSMRR
jgi:hypothetical protein